MLKKNKINFSPAILKLETLLYQNIYKLIHLILYSQSDFDSKKKSGLREKKICQMLNFISAPKILKETLENKIPRIKDSRNI